MTKKILLILGALVFILVIAGNIAFPTKTPPSVSRVTPFPTVPNYYKQGDVHPLPLQNIPTSTSSSQEETQGVNIEAPQVQSSIHELEKLDSSLPFIVDLPLSTGITVHVVIPDQELQNNAWSLVTQIFEINYASNPGDPDYNLMRKSFKEATTDIFNWIKSKGVDPTKIYFDWGEKEYIQQKAEIWLKN